MSADWVDPPSLVRLGVSFPSPRVEVTDDFGNVLQAEEGLAFSAGQLSVHKDSDGRLYVAGELARDSIALHGGRRLSSGTLDVQYGSLQPVQLDLSLLPGLPHALEVTCSHDEVTEGESIQIKATIKDEFGNPTWPSDPKEQWTFTLQGRWNVSSPIPCLTAKSSARLSMTVQLPPDLVGDEFRERFTVSLHCNDVLACTAECEVQVIPRPGPCRLQVYDAGQQMTALRMHAGSLSRGLSLRLEARDGTFASIEQLCQAPEFSDFLVRGEEPFLPLL
jgi:hypothetical protein